MNPNPNRQRNHWQRNAFPRGIYYSSAHHSPAKLFVLFVALVLIFPGCKSVTPPSAAQPIYSVPLVAGPPLPPAIRSQAIPTESVSFAAPAAPQIGRAQALVTNSFAYNVPGNVLINGQPAVCVWPIIPLTLVCERASSTNLHYTNIWTGPYHGNPVLFNSIAPAGVESVYRFTLTP